MLRTVAETTAAYLRRVLPFIGRTDRYLHAAATALLALTFLTPFGAVLFLQDPAESCDMSCCSRSHRCCHRMDSSEKPDDPAWSAAPACGGDCARHIGLPGSPSVTLSADGISVGFAPETESLRSYSKAATFHGATEFALFGRPPPLTLS
jgi:hypothetical protein